MADKDNANPIVYAQSSNPVGRGTGEGEEEWWRDAAMGRSKMAAALSGATSRRAGRDRDSGYGSVDEDEEAEEDEKPVMSADGQEQADAAMKEIIEKVDKAEPIDSQEVFDLIRSISDPEHPLTLEQLAVVNASHITVTPADPAAHQAPHILLEFTPTIPHCSMATLIGLALRVRLLRALPTRYKVDIRVRPGTHQSERAVNKQLNDKERVAAALENQHLLGVVSDCLATAGRRGASEEEALKRADDLALELGITA